MTTTAKTALTGAVLLNLPVLLGVGHLAGDALMASGVALAVIGAALGLLVGWSLTGDRHETIELPAMLPAMVAADERLAA
ncbi:MAG: hypothetical protein QOG33_142 [Gaiellales bacterium]|jgi:hypothetical protein|nr:hypothetical protein [Gaiellales bacterium]